MRRIVKIFFIIIVLALVFPVTTFASKINHGNSDLNGIEENEFEQLIMKIENLKIIYPESSDEMILEMIVIWNGYIVYHICSISVLLLFRYIFKKKKKNSFVNDWIGYIYGMAI